jgi:hypothetical protein
MGTAVNPQGDTLTFDRIGVRRNGRYEIPVMGEIHFTRVPASKWRQELLKMKAGGITVVSTYLFWIHHEEREGEFRWEGERNLRRFLNTCREVGLPVILRLGPWCHGEVRNGGIPEWLATRGLKLRQSNDEYMALVERWWREVYRQVEGLLWKEGGPLIGVQLENEYRGDGAHLMALKGLAQRIGFDVPLYTRTGWPKLSRPVPYGEILPLYGDYPDGFWDRSLDEMPGDYGKGYLFRSFRSSTVIATEQLPAQSATDNPDDVGYPYFTCELGGGMMPSYSRRISIAPQDVYALSLVRIGSGSNLPGYYMYHGGTNPDGVLTTLNETQASPMTNYNELPVRSYDFQAPIRESGAINEHFHQLRLLHLFLRDFGTELATMPSYFPEDAETDFHRDDRVRWAVRSDGHSGYLFVNNYQRLMPLGEKSDVRFSLALEGGKDTLHLPEAPCTIPAGASFFFPFNFPLGEVTLRYATAQPVTRLETERETVYLFQAIDGITPEFAFEGQKYTIIAQDGSTCNVQGRMRAYLPANGGKQLLRVCDRQGHIYTILVVRIGIQNYWKGYFDGRERLFYAPGVLTCSDEEGLTLTPAWTFRPDDSGSSALTALACMGQHTQSTLGIYPEPEHLYSAVALTRSTSKGDLFTYYSFRWPEAPQVSPYGEIHNLPLLPISERVRTSEVRYGVSNLPVQPTDSDFEQAYVWDIPIDSLDPTAENLLDIAYEGDVARLYSGDLLLTDNFYNGKAFEVNLSHYAPGVYSRPLYLKILPIETAVPHYWPQPIREKLKNAPSAMYGAPSYLFYKNCSVQFKSAPFLSE